MAQFLSSSCLFCIQQKPETLFQQRSYSSSQMHKISRYIQKQSPRRVLQKGVLRNFVKFIGKHLCQSLYFDKVAGLTLLKQRLWHKYFPVTFPKFRGRHRRCSVKKGVLRNFAKFTGKQLCQGLFFNKVAGLNCFPVSFAKCLRTPFLQKPPGDCFLKFLRTPFLKEHLRWLLLYMTILVTLLLIFICRDKFLEDTIENNF